MANMKVLAIFAMACVAAAVAATQDLSSDPIEISILKKKTTTTTTTSSTTTPVSTTISTTTSEAPSPAPNTTTTSTTTTAAPNTTTSAPTTPKPQPTTTAGPPVDPKEGKWIANYTNTNYTCLVVQVATQIDVEYKEGNDTKTIAINVPPEAVSEGKCDENEQSITLTWNPSVNVTDKITFTFKKTNDSKFDLHEVFATVNVSTPAQGASVVNLTHRIEEFATPVTKSYKCTKEQILNLTSSDVYYSAQLHISHVQMQAFRNATSTGFDEALDCMGSETPDVVPIAVGCALAALVIIVLIAYLIGRRRSQARGYLSMFTENKREEDYIPMKNISCF